MSTYRRGTILGLTVAETFILLAFLLLIALLLGLTELDELPEEPAVVNAPLVWERPEQIETLVNNAERARAAAERERDQARERAEQARTAQEEAERARAAAERELDQVRERAEQARTAQEEAERARAAAERERDQARTAQEEAERASAAAEHERDQAVLLHRKGNNPPCWYETIPAGNGKTREKPHYAFNAAIHERSIVLVPRPPPPGSAEDDGGESYAVERERLGIEDLPYGVELSDEEFTEAVSELVAHGRNRRVRSYECVFSVMVWDMTPANAKKRWKDAHDRIIEGSFSAYTVRDLEWKGVELPRLGGNPIP